jgi:hypothetical protein
MHMRTASIALAALIAVVAAACTAGSAGTPAGTSGTPAGTPSGTASATAGTAGTPSGPPGTPAGTAGTSPAPSGAPSLILYAQDAAAAVAATNPLLAGIEAKDPNLIGQARWWEATPLELAKPPVPWSVVFHVGWGDCQAGCIDEHVWTYKVDVDGTVTLVSESGSPLSSDVLSQLAAASTWTGVGGRVTAGPTCPVERPGDPSCAPRLVAGAILHITGAGGGSVGQVTTDADGLFRLGLQPGDYTLEPQPVEGLMGTAASVAFTVTDGAQTFLEVDYDTGIR